MTYSVVKHIDARGLNCPIPILRINQALMHLNKGDVISVQANDSGSIKDIETYCRQTGHDLLDSYEINEVYEYIIKKGEKAA